MEPDQHNPWWKKLGWLLFIWAASVAALGLGTYGMRLFMRAAGLTA
ncbi:DUF2474 domain-containing protein [Herminiimonas sp. CN]|nr:DUF2474 domain-containing protein [Herminiimonas sp. CN]